LLALLTIPLSCRSVPPGEREEREALADTGDPYSRPFEERELPPVEAHSPYEDLLYRALRANPKAEEAWFAWAAALERVVVEGTPDNPAFRIGWMFTEPLGGFFENIMVGAAQALMAPSKLDAAARRALQEARAARVRYELMSFELRGRFREAYAEFDLRAREVELLEQELKILGELDQNLQQRLVLGKSATADLARLALEKVNIENELAAAKSELRRARSIVNVKLARDPFDPLDAAAPMRPLRLDAEDAALLRLAQRRNPQVREAASMLLAFSEGVGRARAEGDSDLMPEIEREGTDTKLSLQFTVPLRREKIDAAVAEAVAKFRGAQASLRKARYETAAETARSIVAFREAERRLEFIDEQLRPAAERSYQLALQQFGLGEVSFPDTVEARRTLLQVARAHERARTDREKAVGDLLACCGLDTLDDGELAEENHVRAAR
jgi:cobalt-zinc-cadmium efflux system outer membrane protein